MRQNKKTDKKSNIIPYHVVVCNTQSNMLDDNSLNHIVKKYTFSSISLHQTDLQNSNLKSSKSNIFSFQSFNELKQFFAKHELEEKILIIDFGKTDGFDTIINSLNALKDNDSDFFYLRNSNCFALKNFIYQSIEWDEKIGLENSLRNFIENNYGYTKNLLVGDYQDDKQIQQNVSKYLHLSTVKKLDLFFKSIFTNPFKTKDIYLKRNNFIFKENTIFRILFVLSLVLLFFIMPILSYDSGISGDEDKHVDQAKKVFSYFETHGKDTSYLKSPYGPFYAYNITFDVFLDVLIKKFKIEKVYEFRHVVNSLTGFITILICGLIVAYIAGWRAGLLSIFLLFFSPRFLGHSFNNPKDVPFAMSYVFTIYFILKFINSFPKLSIKYSILIAIGIGLALNIRIGGLLLIAYLFLFVALKVINDLKLKIFNKKNWIYLGKILALLILISAAGYTLGFIFWPYGLEAPLKNPFLSLKNMTNFTISIRQAFEGEFIWSDNVPWYYTIKYILISSPIAVLLGVLISFLTIVPLVKKYGWINIFIIFFSFIFPLAYIIYKKSNVYGGWRHMIFAYIFMIVAASLSLNHLIYIFKNKYLKYSVFALLLLLLLNPIIHTFKSHPLQYIYFNQLVGGTKGAFGNYEMDYYYPSLKVGAEWLDKNILEKDTSSNIIVATNHGELVSYYLRNQEKAKVTYVRYYDRGNSNWDYAIIANSYINPYQQKHGFWPPENTIHTIDVDGVPVCAILKREQKFDYLGYQKLRQKNYFGAIADYKQAIQKEKINEAAYLNLTTAYMYVRRYDLARQTINQLLEIYPKYDKALNLLGLTYFNERNYEEAYKVFTSITEINPKFFSAYHNLGLVFMRMNKGEEAIKYFQQTIKIRNNYKPSYLAIAQILKQMGRDADAQKYIDAANKLK